MDVLVIDIGGNSVKLWHTAHEEHRKFESGKTLTPEEIVLRVNAEIGDWSYEAVALGLPCRVSRGKPVEDPHNLGPGWVSFNFSSALGHPVRIMNDASLQALGSYDGGRMLFLGLGTAVGSTFISDKLILSLDFGRLLHGESRAYELLGDAGFESLGLKKWRQAVQALVPSMKHAMMADYVVLGGGNVKEMEELPDGVRRGHNRNVVEGAEGFGKNCPIPPATPAKGGSFCKPACVFQRSSLMSPERSCYALRFQWSAGCFDRSAQDFGDTPGLGGTAASGIRSLRIEDF